MPFIYLGSANDCFLKSCSGIEIHATSITGICRAGKFCNQETIV